MIPSIGEMRIVGGKGIFSSVLLTDSTDNVYCVDLSKPGSASRNIVASYSGGAVVAPFSTLSNMAIAQFAGTGNVVVINNFGEIVANVVVPNSNNDMVGGNIHQIDGDLSVFHVSGYRDILNTADKFPRINANAGTYSYITAPYVSCNFRIRFDTSNPNEMWLKAWDNLGIRKTSNGGTSWSSIDGNSNRSSHEAGWVNGLYITSPESSTGDSVYTKDGSTFNILFDTPCYVAGGQPTSKDVIHFTHTPTNNYRHELTSAGISSYTITGMPASVTEKIVIPCKTDKNKIVVASIEGGQMYFYVTANRGTNWVKTQAGAATNLSTFGGAVTSDGNYAIATDYGQTANAYVLDIQNNTVKQYTSLGTAKQVANM